MSCPEFGDLGMSNTLRFSKLDFEFKSRDTSFDLAPIHVKLVGYKYSEFLVLVVIFSGLSLAI